jgi:hypothetical protein
MVDISNIPFTYFLSKGNMSSVLPNTLKMSCMLQRRKSKIILERIEHISTKWVLADPLTKGFTTQCVERTHSRHGFYGRAYMISGLLRDRVKILTKWISVLWLINLIVITIMMTHARYIYLWWSGCQSKVKRHKVRSRRRMLVLISTSWPKGWANWALNSTPWSGEPTHWGCGPPSRNTI